MAFKGVVLRATQNLLPIAALKRWLGKIGKLAPVGLAPLDYLIQMELKAAPPSLSQYLQYLRSVSIKL